MEPGNDDCHATVGEDSILPRSVSPQKAIMLGEFVSMSNIFPFNRTLKNETWREANSLPYGDVFVKLQFHDRPIETDN